MKKIFLLVVSAAALLLGSCVVAEAAGAKVKPGIEVLRERGFDILVGKRVGLVTNPSGVDSHLRSTIDILYNAPGVDLVALYGPEHGVRGDVYAGGKVTDTKDEATGLPVHSLYGATRKPTPAMLEGIDVMVSHRNHFMAGGKPFQYGVSATVTYARSRWIIYPDQPNIPENQKVVGRPLGATMAWTADGLYRSEEEIDNSAWYGTRPCVGDIKYVDLNGDGKIDGDDKGFIGRTNRPELTYGLNLDFAWNGIDFNAQFTGGALFDVSLTGTYYNGYDDNTIWTQTFKENANSPLFLVEQAYSIYNPEGTFPRLTLGAPGHGGDNGLASTFWLRDGTYIRLKSAQLGYTLPRKWTEKVNMEALRFFVEGQNIFTIDALPEGIDPESPGVNNGYYPQQRLLMGGVTITF